VGLRNANGFARNEITKKIYTVVNGLDNQNYEGQDVHLDNPGEQIAEVAAGKKYGYPFCFTAQRIVKGGNVVAPGTQLWNIGYGGGDTATGDAWCAANSSPPTTFVQAHSAPLDITFFDKQAQGALPEKWRGGAFVAFHGSWNREGQQTGYKVVWQPFNADGTAPLPTSTDKTTTFPYEVVFGGGSVTGGPVDKSWSWSSDTGGEQVRPAGVAVSPIDGALYVASDQGGFVYRIGVKAN
jgi:glucose/arabinose dehydrogenase